MLELDTQSRIRLVKEHLKHYKLDSEITEIENKISQILNLKKEKNAVILGHNYMIPEVYYGISDHVGDSLKLAQLAKDMDSDIILFNGVHFMAETAKILNPSKKVLIADSQAGCSLEASITVKDIHTLRERYGNIPIISYINCSAAVKAESDIICTSANAHVIVESVESNTVIMLPDAYLANNVAQNTKKKIIAWKGKCMVHQLFTKYDIEQAKNIYDRLHVVAHPECNVDVTQEADFIGSTSQIEAYIEKQKPSKVLLLTECSMGSNLKVKFEREVDFVSTCQTCPHMGKITLDKILYSLQHETYEIHIPEDIRVKALKALENMFALSK